MSDTLGHSLPQAEFDLAYVLTRWPQLPHTSVRPPRNQHLKFETDNVYLQIRILRRPAVLASTGDKSTAVGHSPRAQRMWLFPTATSATRDVLPHLPQTKTDLAGLTTQYVSSGLLQRASEWPLECLEKGETTPRRHPRFPHG